MQSENWSRSEKTIARRAFDRAYERESAALADEVRRMANSIEKPDDIWKIHRFLTQRGKAIEEKYDFRYSELLFVFARLLGEGWLEEVELAGLSEDKLSKIRFLAGRASD